MVKRLFFLCAIALILSCEEEEYSISYMPPEHQGEAQRFLIAANNTIHEISSEGELKKSYNTPAQSGIERFSLIDTSEVEKHLVFLTSDNKMVKGAIINGEFEETASLQLDESEVVTSVGWLPDEKKGYYTLINSSAIYTIPDGDVYRDLAGTTQLFEGISALDIAHNGYIAFSTVADNSSIVILNHTGAKVYEEHEADEKQNLRWSPHTNDPNFLHIENNIWEILDFRNNNFSYGREKELSYLYIDNNIFAGNSFAVNYNVSEVFYYDDGFFIKNLNVPKFRQRELELDISVNSDNIFATWK